jgi:hypothetical protein
MRVIKRTKVFLGINLSGFMRKKVVSCRKIQEFSGIPWKSFMKRSGEEDLPSPFLLIINEWEQVSTALPRSP